MGCRVVMAVKRFGLAWVEQAVSLPRLRSWGGVLGTLRNWESEGGPLTPARPKPTPPDRRQRLQTAAELMAAARAAGIDWHWTGSGWELIASRVDADFSKASHATLAAFGAEVRALLDRERANASWVNPVAAVVPGQSCRQTVRQAARQVA
jgi:hypothetical protein